MERIAKIPRHPGRKFRSYAISPRRVRLPCAYEGPIIATCPCGGEAKHTRHCLHDDGPDECTRAGVCATCPMYDPLSGIRHALLHIYPVKGKWQLWAEQMRLRMPLFNGRRIVGIVMDSRCDPHEAVREVLGDCEYFVMTNRRGLREVQTWRDLWRRLDHRPGDAVFYGQAKGVTRKCDPGNTCHPWASMMMEVLLDYYPVVARALRTHPIVGMGKKPGGFGGSNPPSAWHYSGSYFWTTEVRDWNRIWHYKYGVEAWPGSAYNDSEAASIFLQGDLDFYEPAKFRAYSEELARFRLEHSADCLRSHGGLLLPPPAAR